jgi:segregation and condensation protein B
MDETELKLVLEAALLGAHRPLTLEKLVELVATKAPEADKATVRSGLEALAADYEDRGIELREVASGYRIQVRSRMAAWLQPLWEERPPRYSRALLETLALIAYRQPITRGEIEEVRGVAVNSNIVRSMLERNWIRVVGQRDVPGKPEMFGTTKEFLDYFGLRSIDQLPALAEIREHGPEAFPQADFIESLDAQAEPPTGEVADDTEAAGSEHETRMTSEPFTDSDAVADSERSTQESEPVTEPEAESESESAVVSERRTESAESV